MNSIRLTVFDIFSYIVPGLSQLILCAYALDKLDLESMIKLASGLTIYIALFYAFIAYLTGFILDSLANSFLTSLTNLLRGNLESRVLSQFKEDHAEYECKEYHFATIYAFANVKAPLARDRADQYSAMSGLARNLSLAFLVFAILVGGLSLTSAGSSDWGSVSIQVLLSLLFALIMMFRADTFRRWSHSLLLNVYFLSSPTTNEDAGHEGVG